MKMLVTLAALLALVTIKPALAALPEDVVQYPSCALCEMSREQFAHSRALIEWEDGSKTPLCSVNCMVAAMVKNPDKQPKMRLVADHDTRELLHSRKAFWVIGGSEKGVMTPEPKWAFGTKEAAEAFIGKFGGELTTFDEVMKRAGGNLKMSKHVKHN
jgi:copper chaperone NosL